MNRIFPENLSKNLQNPHDLIQVFSGPRQVGKTTTAHRYLDGPYTHFVSADLPTPPTAALIEEEWRKARLIPSPQRTLVLDEIQKIPRWSEVVKKLHDEDRAGNVSLRVVILGSSAILIEKGLAESLTGRYEIRHFPHWTFPECRSAFGASLADYARIGGYPKAYDFREDPERLENYLQNGIIEPSLGRDILSLHAVDKPALLRQLFWYVSRLPARLVSYQKILDHLQDRGNSATLVHYAELLCQAFLIVPIFKFSRTPHRTKRSIPKWIFPNPALISQGERSGGAKDFVFENIIGAHLLNLTFGRPLWQVHYWRERDHEIDYILTFEDRPMLAIETKSGRKRPEIDKAIRKIAGIGDCPCFTVNQTNVEKFLSRTNLEKISAPL